MSRLRLLPASLRVPLLWLLVLGTAVSACNCDVKTVGLEGGLTVSPTSIDFGTVAIGTIKEQVVKVTNAGRAPVTISSIQLQTASTVVAIVDLLTTNCDGSARASSGRMTLGEGACAQFAVHYGPTSETAMTNTVVVSSNDSEHKTIDIPIKGTGVAGQIQACQMTPGTNGGAATVDMSTCIPGVTPVPTLDFGGWATGETATRTVRVYNLGKYDLSVEDAHVEGETGDFAVTGGNDFSGVIHPGDTSDLVVQYTPATNGNESANLMIPSSDPANPMLTIPITGDTLGPKLCIVPPALAFGPVAVGSSRTLQVTFTNCGEADYDFTQFELEGEAVFTVPASGQTGALPSGLPSSFPVGATLTVNVTFTPTQEVSYSGYLSIVTGNGSTTYQRATVPITGNGGFPGCDSSGGTNYTPTANIQVEEGSTVINTTTTTFTPLTQLTLDASSSTVPAGGGTITGYQWRLVSQPSGGTAALTTPTKVKAGLYVELVGQYVVELVVSTSDSCQSAPVDVTINVASLQGVHVQLTWSQSYGDVDLHYIGPSGSFYESDPEGDLDWNYSWATASGPGTPSPNCGNGLGSCAELNPDWGKNNTVEPDGVLSNNASLDVDQRWGNGPENVTHPQPFDGTYLVYVHYFCSYQGESSENGNSYGDVTATINIWGNGVLLGTYTQAGIGQSQVWEAAQVTVSNNGTTITASPLSGPLKQDTSVSEYAEDCAQD